MKEQVHQIIQGLKPAFQFFDRLDKYAYGHWLSQQYYIVRHSTPLLALSAGRSIDNNAYHMRCIDHLNEEKGHDKMLLLDLKMLGFSIDHFPELLSTQAYYQTQYYWIEHKNPLSFLGYVLFMEELAVQYGPLVGQKAKVINPKSALFLGHHSAADEDHVQDAYAVIAGLSDRDKKHILENISLSAFLYGKVLDELSASKESKTLELNELSIL